jgi:hypothetical protein
MHERASILRFMYIACFVIVYNCTYITEYYHSYWDLL